jgi:hypothetical protein
MSLISQNKWHSHLHFEIASYNMKVNSHFLSFFRIHLIIRKLPRHRSALNVLALSSKQSQCMKVGTKLHYCCKKLAMTLNLPLLYFVWTEEYCQTSPNKNKSPNLWHVTSILVYCIFECYPSRIWYILKVHK